MTIGKLTHSNALKGANPTAKREEAKKDEFVPSAPSNDADELLLRLPPPGMKPPAAQTGKEAPQTPPPAQNVEEHSKLGTKVAAGVALALTGVGVLAGMAQPAMAATHQQVQMQMAQQLDASQPMNLTQMSTQRNTQPQRVNSVEEAVEAFRADKALYVVGAPEYQGRPLSAEDLQKYSEVLKEHPNAYIVLIDRSTDIEADDLTLGRGIGESQAFQSLVNPENGQQDGVVFFVYFNVNNDPNNRMIFMRSEAQLDTLGVGEQNFADPRTNEPRKLLQMYIDGVRSGRHPAQALGSVLTHIDDVVSRAVSDAAGNLDTARELIPQVIQEVRNFQDKYGSGGSFGNPPVGRWQEELQRAEEAYRDRDLRGSARISAEVIQQVRDQQQLMQRYEQAPEVAQGVRNRLDDLREQLASLPDNSQAAEARLALEQAIAQLESFDTSYQAKDASFWDNLQSASGSLDQAAEQADASRSAETRARNIKIGAVAAGALAVVATGVVMNLLRKDEKEEAEAQLTEKTDRIKEETGKLLEFLKKADETTLSGYEGKTKDAAQAVIDSVADALTLAGGAEKFRAQAEQLVHGRGWTAVKNLFLKGNFEKAVELLNSPEKLLKYDLRDSQGLKPEEGSAEDKWIDALLADGRLPNFELPLLDTIDKLVSSTSKADGDFTTLEKKRTEIDSYLAKVEKHSSQVRGQAEKLKAEASDERFHLPAVLGTLLPAVGELLEKGKAEAHHDFVAAWDDFATKADRVTSEGEEIVKTGFEARKTLLPKIDGTTDTLQANGLQTEWAHDAGDKLAKRLDMAATGAKVKSVAEDVKGVKLDMERLYVRIQTAEDQDKERREVCPPLLAECNKTIEDARESLTADMQTMGYFKSGNPDALLREDGRDPSMFTHKGQSHLDLVPGNLDTGDVETAGQNLKAVHDLTAHAHSLVADAKDTVKSYPTTLAERRDRNEKITASIAATYEPSLKRIEATYEADCMRLIASEVGAGDTIADNITDARSFLGTAAQQTDKFDDDFNWGRVLATRDGFAASDKSLKSAQGNLDGVTSAEKSLAAKQQAAESQLAQLKSRVASTESSSRNEWVRSKAKSLLRETQEKLAEAARIVNAGKKNPFTAKKVMDLVENLRGQVETAMAADKRAFDHAWSEVREAESALRSAESYVNSCNGKSWSYHSYNGCGSAYESVNSSDLSGAYSAIRSGESAVSSARSQISSQDYESAASTAERGSSYAREARSDADAGVRRAHDRFEREVARIKQKEREKEAAQHNHHSGGGGGGGGSGTTGGHW